MSETAVSRTPVELWHAILHNAISWNELPTASSDPIEHLNLFQGERCKYYHRFMKSVTTRCNLRLVCRSWDAIIKSAGDVLFMTDFITQFWPSMDVIESASLVDVRRRPISCQCLRKGMVIRHLPNKWKNWIWPKPNEDSNWSQLDSNDPGTPVEKTKVLLVSHDIQEGLRHHLLSRFRSITALSIYVNTSLDLVQMGDTLTRLTDLDLHVSSALRLDESLKIPTLTHLGLHIYTPYIDPDWSENTTAVFTKPTLALSSWEFPKLTVLEISQIVDKVTKEELELFLSKHSAGIECLVVHLQWSSNPYGWDGTPWDGTTELWNSFSRLSTFNIPFDRLVQMDIVPINPNIQNLPPRAWPMTLIISSFSPPEYNSNSVNLARSILRFCTSFPSQITRIALWNTWGKIRRTMYKAARQTDEDTVYGSMRAFFGVLINSDISLCDQEGLVLNNDNLLTFIAIP